jgi:argininosuccinate lyase
MPPSKNDVWSGRLPGGLDPRARALNDSLPVDQRLWPEEIALTRAYGPSLVESGVLDANGLRSLLAASDSLEADLSAGRVTLEGEDVHSAVETELIRRSGDPARRLHTGRSRNDQVSTLVRLRVMRLAEEALEHARELERACVTQARAAGGVMSAAYTHMQPAQPILLAHVWLAHVAAFERDEERFLSVRQAADCLPLGASAIAGTPLRYDRLALAARLGMSRVAENSLDAVGDRDFVLEYLQAAALLGIHLSRLAEDVVYWCSPGFGWYGAPDGFSTGSSLLPQKRNPDVFELARAKSGRLVANAERLAIVLKGLPSGYQKDLQEDKEALFDTADTLESLLSAVAPAVAALKLMPERVKASLTPDLLAVELADSLVAEGVPFREAHKLVGTLWSEAERLGTTPADLPEAMRVAISPLFTNGRLEDLDYAKSLERRNHSPGAGPRAVAEQLGRAEARLGIGAGDGLPRAGFTKLAEGDEPRAVTPATPAAAPSSNGHVLRRAEISDVPSIARLMAEFVAQGVLLPRPVGELYQCIREFHVATIGNEVVACGALRLLWGDLGEVRSLAVRPDQRGKGMGAAIVDAVVADARSLGLPRVIALTREVPFFESCGFTQATRESLPRKVWTDCVQCPRRHACDEVAMVLDLQAVNA